MNYSSKLIEQAVEAFASLPGIGRKTALRLTLHLVSDEQDTTEKFCHDLLTMRQRIHHCSICHNLSDEPVCNICTDTKRDKSLICVVDSIRDVMAIEDTGQYRGLYHVLGGLINPLEGISPADINIDSLIKRVAEGNILEIILAISPTIEGDTTMYYITRKLKDYSVSVTAIARGVSFGGELEYADEVTLGRSIVARIPYKLNHD
jgi:recombination protein RecR